LLPIVIWLAILGKSTAATYPHVEHMAHRVKMSRQSQNGTEDNRMLPQTTGHSLQDVSDRVIELRGFIEKGKSEKDSTDRDLYQYLSDFQEQEKRFNEQFQELICTLNESQLSDIIDEMNKLQDQAQMAWNLKQKQLTDLYDILHHENYTDTALANIEDDAQKEDDVQKECASLAAYLTKANETAQAELNELDKHEQEVEKLQNKLEDCVCPCVWGVWSDWSECTKTCKAGSQSRKRIVAKIPRNGGGCKGGSVETITCNTEVCCPVDCVWGIWEPWPDCPSGCPLEGGQHEKIRTRDRKVEASCNGELCKGKDYEKQPCSREEEVLDMLGTCLSGKVHLAKEKNEMTEDLKKCKDSASTAKAKEHSGMASKGKLFASKTGPLKEIALTTTTTTKATTSKTISTTTTTTTTPRTTKTTTITTTTATKTTITSTTTAITTIKTTSTTRTTEIRTTSSRTITIIAATTMTTTNNIANKPTTTNSTNINPNPTSSPTKTATTNTIRTTTTKNTFPKTSATDTPKTCSGTCKDHLDKCTESQCKLLFYKLVLCKCSCGSC